MQILIITVGPLFFDCIHGGSQKILTAVARHLGECGHRVTILCTRRPDSKHAFLLSPNVEVKPWLRLRKTYPMPFNVAPFRLASTVEIIRQHCLEADVVYCHDGEIPWGYLFADIPTTVSLRDFVYPDTLVGAFGFRRDKLLLNSRYVADSVLATHGMMFPDLESRVVIAPNGIDLNVFRPNSAHSPCCSSSEKLILCPHRPDPRKGFATSLEAFATFLKHCKKPSEYRLMIPKWVDERITGSESSGYSTLYLDVIRLAKDLGIEDRVSLHDWISPADMPRYLSQAHCVLCVGSYVEGFGPNVAIESEACGTPTVLTRVGPQRTTFTSEDALLVDPFDIDGVAKAIAIAVELKNDERRTARMRDYLHSAYEWKAMLHAYEREITGAEVLRELDVGPVLTAQALDDTEFRLAPWCFVSSRGIYNDYAESYMSTPKALHQLCRQPCFQARDARDRGISEQNLQDAITNGLIVSSWHR